MKTKILKIVTNEGRYTKRENSPPGTLFERITNGTITCQLQGFPLAERSK